MVRALVLGDAASVYADAEAALKLFTPGAVFATSNIGIDWPGHVDAWVTLHAGRCEDWIGIEQALLKRLSFGRNRPEIWGRKADCPQAGIEFKTDDWGGASGLLAVKVALEKGCSRIVLAGIPMDLGAAHYYSRKPWLSAANYHRGWRLHLDEMRHRVRSMSGFTRTLLGAPDEEWLADTV